ncbi:hypothetical protein F7R05_15720 [Pseudomonas koreensis]|nr:hypothetical protein F7R05_15720 [Pseudomonas koreensis]
MWLNIPENSCVTPSKHHRKPCGSWLASDSGVSGNINVGSAVVIAGKPAPTGFRGGCARHE